MPVTFPSNPRTWLPPLLLSLSVLAFSVQSLLAAVPADFRVVAQGGAVSPEFAIQVVTLDSLGVGAFCEIEPPDRLDANCTSLVPLALTPSELDTVWNAILVNNFFTLDPAYVDTTRVMGTWADLFITGGGQIHRVYTQNTAVPAFDNVMIVINSVLPAANQIVYNEIAP